MKSQQTFLNDLLVAILLMLWVYAAISKLVDFNTFTSQLLLQPFTRSMAMALRLVLPVSELLTAILLAFASTRILGAIVSLFLLIIFTGYILAALFHYFPQVPCSCGGILQKLSWQAHLMFNITFIIINLYTIKNIKERRPQA